MVPAHGDAREIIAVVGADNALLDRVALCARSDLAAGQAGQIADAIDLFTEQAGATVCAGRTRSAGVFGRPQGRRARGRPTLVGPERRVEEVPAGARGDRHAIFEFTRPILRTSRELSASSKCRYLESSLVSVR